MMYIRNLSLSTRGTLPRVTLRRRLLTSSEFASFDEQEIIRGTKLWIHEVVAKNGLCPFAAKSKYEIIVHDGHQDPNSLLNWHIDDLAASTLPPQSNPSKLLIFPHIDNEEMLRLYYEVADDRAGELGKNEDVDPHSSQMKVQAVAFSSAQTLSSWPPEFHVHLQAFAPWNTIQLLRYSDLKVARGKKTASGDFAGLSIGEAIQTKNMHFDAGLSNDERVKMLTNCIENARTRHLQLTRELTHDEMERLSRDGVQVEQIKVANRNSTNLAADDKPLRINLKKSKSKHKKKKSKRKKN